MYIKDASFDAVITDKLGRTREVDCRVTVPAASGLPASISIEIPLTNEKQEILKNPCMLRGENGGLEIEIKDLWYRWLPLGPTDRKHERGALRINHAGSLWVRQRYWKSERTRLRFLLSPVRFFKKHSSSTTINYSATPNMRVELFKLQTEELGEIRFIKFWSVHHVDQAGVAAEIRASFAAEVLCNDTTVLSIDHLVEKMKAVLIPLSILTRQAITLHGWIWEKLESIEMMWFDPLEPNLAPDMAEAPIEDLCLQEEFDACAQAFVEKFLGAPPDIQEAITLIAVALAPHIKRTTSQNFFALFSALEQVIALEKHTKEERERLRESDAELRAALLDLKCRMEEVQSPNAATLVARIEGLARSVDSGGPSLKVRFEKFQCAYPKLALHLSDLWPLHGTPKLPGLKQIRDSLAHGLRDVYTVQAIAVAHWHFARLAERLAFVVLNTDVPYGLHSNSLLLRGESWYQRSEWQAIRATAAGKL